MVVDLFSSRENKYSQFGEDGILRSLTTILGLNRGMFVEFGAWDGQYLSNTRNLIDEGWSGCYIEGNPKRFEELRSGMRGLPVTTVCAIVEPEGPHSLDNILEKQGVKRVDLLSIDIDSDDLAIWASITKYCPAIVIIEYNPTIPFDTRYVNPRGKCYGNSALSLKELGISKGYRLAEGTHANLIFVRDDIAEFSGIPEKDLQAIHDQLKLTRYFFGFDSTLIRNPPSGLGIPEDGPIILPWSSCVTPQPLPRVFRFYSDQENIWTTLRLMYCSCRVGLRSPIDLYRLIKLFRSKRARAA